MLIWIIFWFDLPFEIIAQTQQKIPMYRVRHHLIKDDVKRYQKNRLYRKQSNVLLNHTKCDQGRRYLVELNFLADQNNSLIDVFHYFFHSIYEIPASPTKPKIQKTTTYNRIFRFCIKMYFLQDKFVPKLIKSTEQDVISEMDIIGKYKSSLQASETSKNNLKTLISQLRIEISSRFQQRLTEESKDQPKSKEFLRYLLVLKMCEEQKVKTIQQIINLEDRERRLIYIPKDMEAIERLYLQKLLDTLISIRFTKKPYRSMKFTNFLQKMYKDLYRLECSEIANIKDNCSIPRRFVMQRYTNNDRQYLTDVYSLIDMRDQDIKYDQQSFQICKQTLKELILHKNCTKTSYPLLSPKSVIFNQLSLKVQLSYENPLLSSLGLLNRPANFENMICYQASPKPYDTFANANQLIRPDLLANHLIGADRFFKEKPDHQQPQNMRDNAQSLEQHQQIQASKSESWRFMMTIYYIMNGKEYFKGSEGKKIVNFQDFSQFVQRQEQKLDDKQNEAYYLKLMGQKFSSYLPKRPNNSVFYPNIYFFQSLFNGPEEEDYLLKQYCSIKMAKYLKTFNTIFKELIVLIESQTVCKVYNTVVYLFRFYLGIFKELFQAKFLLQCTQDNNKINTRVIESKISALKSLKKEQKSYFQSAFSKLEQYKDRFERRQQTQITYMMQKYRNQCDKIAFYYQLVGEIHENLDDLIEDVKYGNPIDLPASSTQKDEKIKNTRLSISKNMAKLKRTIQLIGEKEFFSHSDEVFEKKEDKYYKNKLKLLFTAIFSLNSQNFIIIQSIVLPMLSLGKTSNKKSKNVQKQKLDYNQLSDLCEYSLQILNDKSTQTNSINQAQRRQNCYQQPWKQHRQEV